jgi:hypothetical protein
VSDRSIVRLLKCQQKPASLTLSVLTRNIFALAVFTLDGAFAGHAEAVFTFALVAGTLALAFVTPALLSVTVALGFVMFALASVTLTLASVTLTLVVGKATHLFATLAGAFGRRYLR